MNRILFFILTSIVFISSFLKAQDSLINRPIKEFNLTTEYLEYIINKTENNKPRLKDSVYEDCNYIIPVNDSSFKLNHKDGKSLIHYKDIKEISFRGRSKFGTGLWQGAIAGAVVGIVITAIIISKKETKSNPPKEFEGFGLGLSKVFAAIIIPPTTTLLGTIIGGIIGATTNDYSKYNFDKYTKEEKKKEVLKIFSKYRTGL
jgi:hypothetical protein